MTLKKYNINARRNTFYENKKLAAMFGLDARIALAIFGALSVITGAALYSSIKNAKATATLTELQEQGKAWESYYIDTGQNLKPLDGSDKTKALYYNLRTIDLKADPSIKGWKGPYLNGEDYNGETLKDSEKLYTILMLNKDNWSTSSYWRDNICKKDDNCFIYVNFTYLAQDKSDFARNLDKMIDNVEGDKQGKFRWCFHNGATYIFLQYAPIKNPNN